MILGKITINKGLKEYYEYFLRIINQENNINYLEQKKLFNSQFKEIDFTEYTPYVVENFEEKKILTSWSFITKRSTVIRNGTLNLLTIFLFCMILLKISF